MANGKIVYTPIGSAEVTYTFVRNFAYGCESGYLDSDITQRAADGTLRGYSSSYRKQHFTCSFNRVSVTQKNAIDAAWAAGVLVKFYFDSSLPGYLEGRIIKAPAWTQDYGVDPYSGDFEFEEA